VAKNSLSDKALGGTLYSVIAYPQKFCRNLHFPGMMFILSIFCLNAYGSSLSLERLFVKRFLSMPFLTLTEHTQHFFVK
jgi:hypothetical protein